MTRSAPTWLGIVLIAVALTAGATPALAEDRASCQLQGVLAVNSPGVETLSEDSGGQVAPFGILGDTDQDPYLFTLLRDETFADDAFATCARVDTDPGEEANTGVYTVRFSSRGLFINWACGLNAVAHADDPLLNRLSSDAAGWQGPIDATYTVSITGAAGRIRFTGGSWDGTALQGRGVISVRPLDTDGDLMTTPCVDQRVEFFELRGGFEVATS